MLGDPVGVAASVEGTGEVSDADLIDAVQSAGEFDAANLRTVLDTMHRDLGRMVAANRASNIATYRMLRPGRRLPGGRLLRSRRLAKKHEVELARQSHRALMRAYARAMREKRAERTRFRLLPVEELVGRFNAELRAASAALARQIAEVRRSLEPMA